LTDYEATRKDAHTFKFIDLCKNCFEEVKPFMSVIDRKDLITEQDLDVVEDDADLDTTEDWEDLSYFDAQFYRGFI
jgi:ferritin